MNEEEREALRLRQKHIREKREAKIEATNEAIEAIIDGTPYDQREFDKLLNLFASAYSDWFLDWIQGNINDRALGDDIDKMELEWA